MLLLLLVNFSISSSLTPRFSRDSMAIIENVLVLLNFKDNESLFFKPLGKSSFRLLQKLLVKRDGVLGVHQLLA